MSEHYDEIVFGASCTGSYYASLKQCLLIDKKKVIGKPLQCSGLVSNNLKELIKIPKRIVLNKINGALIKSENEEIFIKKKGVARVINRIEFDQWLFEKAGEKSETILGERYVTHKKVKKGFKIKTNKRTLFAKRLILATGPNINKPCLKAVQATVKMDHDDYVEVILNNDLAPKFFAWLVPQNDDNCLIGLATHNPKPYFKKLLKHYDNPEIIGWSGGLIPQSFQPPIRNGVTYLGDAGAQSKATSGGGIITGMKTAKIISEGGGNVKWFKEVGLDLYAHHLVRKFLNKLTNKDYDELIRVAHSFKNELEKHGDMEYVRKYLLKVVNKDLLWFVLKHLFK